MKLILIFIISGLICYIGFKIGGQYWQKQNFYENFCKFLIYLKAEIGFLKSDLIQILSNYSTNDYNLKKLLNNYIQFLQKNEYVDLQILNDDENFELMEFIQNISKSDCYSIENIIEKYQAIFNKKLENSKQNYLKSGVLYKKLSILLAIFVCIVLL